MYQTNLSEMFRERQLTLMREAEDRRLARRLQGGSKGHARSDRRRPGAGFRRAIATWGRTSIPFFRA